MRADGAPAGSRATRSTRVRKWRTPSPGGGWRARSAAPASGRWRGARRRGRSCAWRSAPGGPVAELVGSPIDVAALLRAAARPDCGAVNLFLGATRDHHGGRRVTRLAYEAFEPMALETLAALEREACGRFAIAACTVVHRLGEVPVSEPSVAVVVSAPHRAPAFAAARWVMDTLKRRAPIWKKEFYADGETGWVEGAPLEGVHDPARGCERRGAM